MAPRRPPFKSLIERRRIHRWGHELDRKDRARKRRKHQNLFKERPTAPQWLKTRLENKLLAYLRNNIQGQDISSLHTSNDYWVIKIPRDFSFITNPSDTLNVLHSVVAVSSKTPKMLVFDHRDCKDMDLGASAALDVIAMNLQRERNIKGDRFILGGFYPQDQRVLELFVTLGMTKHLQIAGSEPPPEVDAKFTKFPLFTGRKQGKGSVVAPSQGERAASDLAQYLDKCFREAAECTFTPEGQRYVLHWAGELITNAEEHSEQAEWYAIACMRPIESRDPRTQVPRFCGECQLVIFNFGRSIYESLSSAETPSATRDQIEQLVDRHMRRNLFAGPGYAPEDLWTLYALQEGVSRFSPEPGKIDRGKGTVKMIAAFQALGDSIDANLKPEMSLISGTTRIHFTKRYQMKPISLPGGTRNIMAFNDLNSLDERPDPRYVHSMRGKFPGTLLTFRFFIDKKYLEERLRKNIMGDPK